MRQPRACWRAAVAVMFLAAQVSAIATPVASQAQTKPTTTKQPSVDEGQSYYEQSRFDDAITLLKQLVDQGVLQGAELQRAQELLARSYVKKGYPVQAKEMFKAMLLADSTYRPDPIRVPPDETAVFEEALKEYQTEKATAAPLTPPAKPAAAAPGTPSPEKIGVASSTSGKKKGLTSQWWFWAGGALVVGGIAAVAMAGGGGDDAPTTTVVDDFGFPPPP